MKMSLNHVLHQTFEEKNTLNYSAQFSRHFMLFILNHFLSLSLHSGFVIMFLSVEIKENTKHELKMRKKKTKEYSNNSHFKTKWNEMLNKNNKWVTPVGEKRMNKVGKKEIDSDAKI